MRVLYPAGPNGHRESDYILPNCVRQELGDLYLSDESIMSCGRAIIYKLMQQLRPERFEMLPHAILEEAFRVAVRAAIWQELSEHPTLESALVGLPSQHLRHFQRPLRRINYMTNRRARQRLQAFYQYRAASKYQFHKPTGYL